VYFHIAALILKIFQVFSTMDQNYTLNLVLEIPGSQVFEIHNNQSTLLEKGILGIYEIQEMHM